MTYCIESQKQLYYHQKHLWQSKLNRYLCIWKRCLPLFLFSLCPFSNLYTLYFVSACFCFSHIFTFTHLELSYIFSPLALFHKTRQQAHLYLSLCSITSHLMFCSPKLKISKSHVGFFLNYLTWNTLWLSFAHNRFVNQLKSINLQSKCMLCMCNSNPLFAACPESGRNSSRLSKVVSPAMFSSPSWRIPRVLGLPQGRLPVRRTQKTSKGRFPGDIRSDAQTWNLNWLF